MKPLKNIFLIFFLFAAFQPLSAAENKKNSSVLDDVDRLITQKQYQSAWTLLHDEAEDLDISDMILKKTELTLLYYAKTNLHQMFAFADLRENEELSDIRGQEGSFDFKLYDPAGALTMVIKENPDRREAYYWLAEYYHQVMTLYGEEWEKPQEDIRSLVIANFRMAAALGMETEEIYSKLSYTELLSGSWEAAVEDLQKALEYNNANPAYYHDLAIAHLNMKKNNEALSYIEKAINLYTDPFYKADSAFLASTIALHLEDSDKAESYLIKGGAFSPDDYRFPDRLIRLYLNKSDFVNARDAAGDLFAMYPENPANCTTIIQYFYSVGKLDETSVFFKTQLEKYQGQAEILGNLYFHKAISARYQGLNDEALESFTVAETEFAKVYSRDNQVFQAIEKMTAELLPTE
ncbi:MULTISPECIES: lipopolysaccharide assembly protein LapB [unclassified Oceanispirochaeta]|uniref:tetratricopeptide repeat protein n=1 Tax=unclassified Oceanispirochaeta TaxID=2635722 RepID=UPI000E092BD9|nr:MULTISPECIES: tetratricopeptide repeat protein [unclassified Oceanispirochaeta]MBF9014224.1 tetratricopeptide repeat protein [Oceanispirochaeta sp. M2]NPD71110.1 tetratricopeptide repeat protein [Oceanispirochaeta sp. M1]RDG33505.1 tetratricopeptide repeat protein [Oceanispirochaeta sp. M1]